MDSTVTPLGMAKMIKRKRADYMLIDEEDYKFLNQQNEVDAEDVKPVRFSDMPPGLLRYIMCSKSVSPDAMARLDKAIAQIAPGVKLFDAWVQASGCIAVCPLSTLPGLAGVRLEAIPAPVPYLRADPARAAAWRARLDELVAPGSRRVGLVWAGRPTHRNDRNRSVALSGLGAITGLDGVTFVSLQKGPAVTQVGGYFGRVPLVNLGPELADFEDTLAVMDGLDLVLTVDTAVGHLAGAAGKPVWVMLPHAPDWRWLMARADSPWYPTMRLFRAPAPRDWGAVTAEVAAALRDAFSLDQSPSSS